MKRILYSKEIIEKITTYLLTTENVDVRTSSARFDVDEMLIYRLARKNNVKLVKPVKPPMEKHLNIIQFIRENNDLTISEIAEETGESYNYIHSLCNENKLTLKRKRAHCKRSVPVESNTTFFNPSLRSNWLI